MLTILRGLVFVKRNIGPLYKKAASPFAKIGRFFLCTFGVPIYRLVFFIKRQSSHVLSPAKHRLLYLVSNRYAVHVVVIAVVAVVSMVNFGGSEVRAESYGKQSMLYALVSDGNLDVVEVVAATDEIERKTSSYMDDVVVDADIHLDLNYVGEAYVTTAVGEVNQIAAAINIETAQAVARDKVENYTIQDGDTLSTISEKYGLNLNSLLWANNLTSRSTIKPGQELKIVPVDGVVYTVKKGDTLNAIANEYNADSDEILTFNKLASADGLTVGNDLMIPNGEPPTIVAKTQTTSTATTTTGTTKTTAIAPVTSIFSAPKESTTEKRGSSTGSGTWVWPTDWRVITQYYGWRHTGVDIDGDYSTNSYAAADGTVIFSGWKGGYGICVEIDHGNGYVTRYAHHSKNYVKVGDVVTAGQAIAQTGTTGRSTGTHLHFEVIKNGKFQNPLDYVR